MTRDTPRNRGRRDREVVRRPRRSSRHRPHRARRHRLRPARAPTAPARPPWSASSPPSSAPMAGQARVAGFDVRRQPDGVRRSIGVTGQFSAIDGLLTGRENLRLMADLAHLNAREAAARVERAAGPVRAADAADRRAATYSGGMKRRLDLAMTLVSRPRVIFLDEPTDRARPAQPSRPVADRPRAARRRRDDLPHHAVPRGGRPAGPHRRAARRRPAGREGYARPSSRRRRAGRPSTTCSSRSPATPLTTDDHDDRSTSRRRAGGDPMTTLTYAVRDSTTMLRRNLKHLLPLPVADADADRACRWSSCCCSSTSSAAPWAPGSPADRAAAGRLPGLRHPGDPGDDGRVGGATAPRS